MSKFTLFCRMRKHGYYDGISRIGTRGNYAGVGSALGCLSPVVSATVYSQEKKLERFLLSNSTISESRAPLYMAQDLKLFEKYGLDTQIVNIRGSAINNAALMAGEIQMAVANGTIAMTAAARGAPIVILATIGPTRYSLVSPADHFGPAIEGQNHRHRRLRHRRLFYRASACCSNWA